MIRFCRHVDASFIRPRAGEIVSFLLKYLGGDIKEEALYLILETLNAVMRTDLKSLDAQSVAAIGEAVFDVWLRNATGTSYLPRSGVLNPRSCRYSNCRRAFRDDHILIPSNSYFGLGQSPLP